MTSQQNTDRIQTTQIGSLPRPHSLLDAMKAKYAGQAYDERAYEATFRPIGGLPWFASRRNVGSTS